MERDNFSASKVTTLWHYTNAFIIIIIITSFSDSGSLRYIGSFYKNLTCKIHELLHTVHTSHSLFTPNSYTIYKIAIYWIFFTNIGIQSESSLWGNYKYIKQSTSLWWWRMAQLMPLPLTVSCFSKIQIGFTFLVAADLGSPGKRAIKRVCVCKQSTSLWWWRDYIKKRQLRKQQQHKNHSEMHNCVANLDRWK